jgi:hypothetical protein
MGSRLVGAKLSWQGLDAKAQQASGLPPAGTLLFDTTGERFSPWRKLALAEGASSTKLPKH